MGLAKVVFAIVSSLVAESAAGWSGGCLHHQYYLGLLMLYFLPRCYLMFVTLVILAQYYIYYI
jgi:hypothetical protein